MRVGGDDVGGLQRLAVGKTGNDGISLLDIVSEQISIFI